MRPKFVYCILAAICLACSCSAPKKTSPVEDLPSLESLTPDPSRKPSSVAERPASVSLSQILCSYRGAVNAKRDIERTRKQTLLRAQHLLKLARAKDTSFEDLAQRYSDDSRTSMDGGDLGTINPGELHPDLESAAFGLNLGQVSDVTESPKGFHILRRQALKEAQAAEILISYQGAKRRTPRQPRSQQEARTLADQILNRLRNGSSFEAEALAHSDLPSHTRGGFYKIFQKGSQHPKFEEIVWSLKYGEVSEVVETDTGFHIVTRLPVQRIQVRQILIRFHTNTQEDAFFSGEKIRTKANAYQLAEKIHKMAQEPDNDFAALAARHSEGPEKGRLGLLDEFGRGQIAYLTESAAFSVKPGQISGVVETEGGYTIIKRIR